MNQPKKVLIVGSKFGEVYLNAFVQHHPDWRLAGLLAHGSPRSRTLAKAFGIPLFSELAQLPGDLDLVCIVVRSSIVKGDGSKLAEYFLQQGTSVLQEHPVHPDEIARLQHLARSSGCHYWVNSFYPYNAAGQIWINNSRDICHRLQQPPVWGQMITSRQLLYSALDLFCQAMVYDPAEIDVVLEKDDSPLQTLWLLTPDGHYMLCLQKHLSVEDPDQYSLVMHHLMLGWPAGYLSLGGSYGPVTWHQALSLHDHQNNGMTMYQNPTEMGLDIPVCRTLSSVPESWQEVMESGGPEAVRHVLVRLNQVWLLPEPEWDVALQADYQLALSRLWQKVLQAAGQAEAGMAVPFRALVFGEREVQE